MSEQLLRAYLPPKVVNRLLRDPRARQPGGEKQTIGILASDIATFSRIAERRDPREVMQFLNDYYRNAIRCVHEADGTVLNLVGDGMFAIWNAPEPQPDHPSRALISAAQSDVLVRALGLFRFAGFDRVVEVYEVLVEKPAVPGDLSWRDAFAQGLHHFRRQAWSESRQAFLETVRLRPGDGPAQFYLDRVIPLYRSQAVPRDWDGTLDAPGK